MKSFIATMAKAIISDNWNSGLRAAGGQSVRGWAGRGGALRTVRSPNGRRRGAELHAMHGKPKRLIRWGAPEEPESPPLSLSLAPTPPYSGARGGF
jgi:hypothetical protein